MTKYIFHLTNTGFLLTFLFLISCGLGDSGAQNENNSTHADCVESILAKDAELGEIRNHACEKISLEQTIGEYVDGLKAMDFNACSPGFSQAFEKHIQAWISMMQFVKNYPDMRGEMHVLFDEIEKGEDAESFKPLLKNIWDTWGEIEKAKAG